MATSYEYKVLVRITEAGKYTVPDDELNAMGADGWELVTVLHTTQYYTSEPTALFYFKRGK